ncbi:hypothetical protein K2173_008191 [Erythroxylum novogranatense]|uniref:GOST seven transmembrane domain-containing protein n=1 Tax=Erythroxylum novogranatense TaxID=1862640 RepID=A0AAV8UCA9_9ROSI|nr:hypothetical protein K2173_008191 [Erythroxylum novogranatense]
MGERVKPCLLLGFWVGFVLCLKSFSSFVKEVTFIPQSNAFFFHAGNEGIHASKVHNFASTSPEKPSKENRSLGMFEDVVFVRPKEVASKQNEMQQSTGFVEAIILEVKDRERIGGAFLKTNVICCTPTLAESGSCKLGEVIIKKNPDNPEWLKRIKTSFAGKNKKYEWNPKGTLIKGRTIWKNPYGYLLGKMTPLMTFSGIMSLAYLALGILRFLRFVHHWKDIIQLHYYIIAVTALGMREMVLTVVSLTYINNTISIVFPFISTVKKTLSRLLLLAVSMGYGIVKPTFGGITSRILLLGLIYFIASEAFYLVENLANINDFLKKTKLFLVLPIFSSPSKTLEKLQFTNSFEGFVLLSIAWIGFEVVLYSFCSGFFRAQLYFNTIAWVNRAFWTLLACALLILICVLWAPSRNPTSGMKATGHPASKLERIGLVDGLEEDKRE